MLVKCEIICNIFYITKGIFLRGKSFQHNAIGCKVEVPIDSINHYQQTSIRHESADSNLKFYPYASMGFNI